ncbi:MAG: hypothetical protein QM703_21685 [Gemmatales bacterium]
MQAQRSQQQANFQAPGTGGSSGNVVVSLDTDAQIIKARAFILGSLRRIVLDGGGEGLHTPPYFLWSLERVATLYKWRKLEGFDWFDIGATYILKKQSQRGNWVFGREDTGVDSAFCLLFLAKSNLLGSLQEATFDNRDGNLGDAPKIDKNKKTEAKQVDTKEKAKALADKLLNALPNQQGAILDELTEGKGFDYSEALADVITKLSTNASKEAAREALANRMRRLTAKTLGDYMQDNDRELRLAAAVAVRLKNDPSAAVTLIPLLADQDIGVSTAALDSLKAISGQDFGKSVERWSRWLDTKKP